MHSDRHDRVAALLQSVAATFVQQEANTDPLITITRVSISPDYKRATVFFTTIPDGREEDALIFLKRAATDLRHELKKKCNLKIIPHLEFSVDYGERHRQHIDTIASTLKTDTVQTDADNT